MVVRILLADDDEGIRALIKRVMAACLPEYDLFLDLVSSYDEAVSLIRHSQDGWDVAILDGAIPMGGDGELLAGFLRERFPGIKIVSCSSESQSWGDKNIRKSAETLQGLPIMIKEVLSLS